MSWSFKAIGTTEKLVEALEGEPERISKDPNDYCRVEFEAAKPHLIGLVKQNFAEGTAEGTAARRPLISLTATGSATSRVDVNDPTKRTVVASNVSVELTQHYNFVG